MVTALRARNASLTWLASTVLAAAGVYLFGSVGIWNDLVRNAARRQRTAFK